MRSRFLLAAYVQLFALAAHNFDLEHAHVSEVLFGGAIRKGRVLLSTEHKVAEVALLARVREGGARQSKRFALGVYSQLVDGLLLEICLLLGVADVAVSLVRGQLGRFARKVHLVVSQPTHLVWLVAQDGNRLVIFLRFRGHVGRCWDFGSNCSFVEEDRWVGPLLGPQLPLRLRMGRFADLTVGTAVFDTFQPVFDLELLLLTLGDKQVLGNRALSFLVNALSQSATRMPDGLFM